MQLFRNRTTTMRPFDELREEFMRRPDAETLLQEADRFLQFREEEYSKGMPIVDLDVHILQAAPIAPILEAKSCSAPTLTGGPCGHKVALGSTRCAAGHPQ